MKETENEMEREKHGMKETENEMEGERHGAKENSEAEKVFNEEGAKSEDEKKESGDYDGAILEVQTVWRDGAFDDANKDILNPEKNKDSDARNAKKSVLTETKGVIQFDFDVFSR